MRTFEDQELGEKPPLLPIQREDEILQRDTLGMVAKLLLKKFALPQEQFDAVANAVGIFWMNSELSKRFRRRCCAKPDKLKKRLWQKLVGKTNAERVDFVLNHLGFLGVEDFMKKNFAALKKVLLEQGIDVDVACKARELLL